MFNQHLEISMCAEDIVRLGKKDSTKQRLLRLVLECRPLKLLDINL